MLPTVPTRDLASLMNLFVGPRLGVVGRLHVLPRSAGEIPLCHVTAAPMRWQPGGGGEPTPPGGASHFDVQGSALRALMEAIERYCGAAVDYQRLVVSKPHPGVFLHGERLPLFAPAQYQQPGWPFRPLGPDSEIRWVDGRSLCTGRRWLVPAGLVYVPYDYGNEAERLGPSTSTGMACAWSRAEATLTGLLEVCERDAFAIAWLNRLSMPRLRVAAGSRLAGRLARLLDAPSSVTFVNLTNDLGVPVVMAVLRRRLGGQPLVTVGLSARPRLEDAAEKAFIEAASEEVRLRDELARPGPRWQPSEGFKNVSDFAWHSLVYVDPALQPQLDFLTASDVEQPMEQPAVEGTAAELLLRYTGQLARAGLDVIVVGLTTREVASVGLHVVKVLVPAAVPLNPHHRAPWLGHRRLYTVPCALGYRRQPPAPDELNLAYPHPFA